MKRKTKVIINGNKKIYNYYKLITNIALLIVFIIMLSLTIQNYITNKEFATEVNEFAKMNSSTVFSIDKVYLYSSASATSNEDNRPIWNLNVNQYTDIALYLNNRPVGGQTYENSIKRIWIDNIKFSGPQAGTPSLYYKDISEFAKYNLIDNNKINDSLEYSVLNDGDIDYSKPQIYSNCQNPITLEYVNSNIKENMIISDISSDLKFDGNLLRRTGVFLDTINCTISFNVNIINYYNQRFIANVYIDVPLSDTVTNDSIYSGKLIKRLENTNLIKFYRME